MTPQDRARTGYAEAFGDEPEGLVFVPGRVNLIGEHVDYNDGLVLPMPISAGTAIAWGRSAGQVEAVALDFGQARDAFMPSAVQPHQPADWRSYLRGTAHALASGLAGARLAIAGSIPRGSGLSSSASFCVAVGRALAAAAGMADTEPRQLARAAQSAEHDWAGVHCGIMDQMAVAAGQAGHALLLDCADLATRHVPLPADWAVMIVQSGVRRGLVDGHYNQRRLACEAAARALGLPSLRHADRVAIEAARLDGEVRNRALHVVDEIARTAEAARALEAADLSGFGAILRAGHDSLRDLFEVSVPAVDALVAELDSAIGCEGGARMTGGGFGGAVVAVMPRGQAARVARTIRQNYRPPEGAALDLMIESAGPVPAGVH